MDYLGQIQLTDNLRILITFLISAIGTWYVIPILVRIAHSSKMYDHPNLRTVHFNPTPRLAGIAIFLAVILTQSLFTRSLSFPLYQYVIAGSVIIFFIGIKDDILGISFGKKFVAEIAAALILILFADLRINSFHGYFGAKEISYTLSFFITLIIIIGITNAFNLIDGVDGLSGTLALTSFATFGVWFYINNQPGYALLCAATIGSLLAFLRFNIWGKKNKIFMGDTGALFLGFLMSILLIRFNEMNLNSLIPWHIEASPVVSFGILIIPIFDTCRVMLSRILQGKSPFQPDKTHIHHQLLNLGFSHKQVTAILFLVSIGYIILSFEMQHLNLYLGTTILVGSGLILTYIPIYINQKKKHTVPWTVIKTAKKKAG